MKCEGGAGWHHPQFARPKSPAFVFPAIFFVETLRIYLPLASFSLCFAESHVLAGPKTARSIPKATGAQPIDCRIGRTPVSLEDLSGNVTQQRLSSFSVCCVLTLSG